jgi:predicted phage tail component-like protein
MLFNGLDLTLYMTINRIEGRGISPSEISTLEIPGMDGAYYSSKRRPVRNLTVSYTIVSENAEELRRKINELNAFFDVEEPAPIEFEDEPGITYFGIPQETTESGEFVTYQQGSITFLCVDPYKYGEEKVAVFPSDSVRLTNEGSASTRPILEMEVLAPITFAMIQNHAEQYQMIGQPVDEEGLEEVVDTKVSVLKEDGSNLDSWHFANPDSVDTRFNDLSGDITTDGAGIRANGYGTGDRMHGPAVTKELSSSIQDFEIVSTFDIISRRDIENWRMEIYFHDEHMNMLGKLGVKDNRRNYKRRHGLGRVGHYRGSSLSDGYAIGSRNYLNDNARDTTLMYFRVRREGQRYEFYIAEWHNLRHRKALTASYNDTNNEFQGRLKYITLFIGKYQDRPNPSRLRINNVEVFELSTITEDQTPYIAYPGDIITFDHGTKELLINGEDRSDLKDFGGEYFDLRTGENQLIVHPSDALATQARYRERFK